MGRRVHRDRLRAPIDKAWQFNGREQGFTTAQNDGRQRQVQLVDRCREQLLADRRNPATDLHDEVARGGLGLGDRRVDPVGDEMEGLPALHCDWRSGVVDEDEGQRVIRRIEAPLTFPVGPAPIVAGRPELVAAEDEGAEAFRRGAGEAIVSPAASPQHRFSRLRKNPLSEPCSI